MGHYVIFTPAADFQADGDDWDWSGTWTWVCDCDTTQSCRWTSDCDCEEWTGMQIAEDGSSATHTHYRFDDDDEGEEGDEVDYPMTVAAECGISWWFDEDDKDALMPPRPGKHEVTVGWDYDFYTFEYAGGGAR